MLQKGRDSGVCNQGSGKVVFVIKVMVKDYLPWTPSRRDARGRRKVVEPHNIKVKEMCTSII
jgi:hypothetical protein